jgi:ribonuclease HII
MLIVGVDENGLGPLLGPLVVTAAAFEVQSYDREAVWSALPAALVADDSKQLFSRSKIATAEHYTLAWLEAFGIDATTHADLAAAICASLPWPLPCQEALPICRPGEQQLPVWSADPRQGPGTDQLVQAGLRPRLVRSLVVCAGAFNTAVERDGMNKLRLDFQLMMRLLAEISKTTGEELRAICGKVGSTRRYGPWLDGLGCGYLWAALDERPERSDYRVAGLGTVSFVRDADADHLPVAVASMIGKYLRELAMHRLNVDLGWDGPQPASGYRDPLTARFAEQTASRREEIGLVEACFARRS